MTSFAETTPDALSGGKVISHAERLQQIVEEIIQADKVGLDVYGLGEHHREDYAASSPATILAAASTQTKNIRLSSAVTVLSSDDPVRVYQQFATLDGLSNGRAELMVGRGSFTESYPLFGYGLEHYDELFAEKLDLLLQLRQNEPITWQGDFRASIMDTQVFPTSVQKPLPVWIAVGGTPASFVRAGRLGLPLNVAIIGGNAEHFYPLIQLYRQSAQEAGFDPNTLEIGVHSHGYLADTNEQAIEEAYPSMYQEMNKLGRERGWMPYTRASYEAAISEHGSLYIGDSEHVIKKIRKLKDDLGVTRFMLHMPLGTMPHDKIMHAIELLGTEVRPAVLDL